MAGRLRKLNATAIVDGQEEKGTRRTLPKWHKMAAANSAMHSNGQVSS